MSLHRRYFFLSCLVLCATPAWAQSDSSAAGTNYETRLSTVEDEMRTINGQLEKLDFSVQRLDQVVQRMQSDFDTRLTKLESAAPQTATSTTAPAAPISPTRPTTPTTPTAAPASSASVAGTLGELKMQDGHITGGTVSPKAPPLPNAPADYGLTPQEQFDRAFGLLRQANYDEAEQAFKTFIEKNPKDRQIDVAKFWYAETLYVRNRYDASAVAFADAYQQNPKGSKAPDSLLNMALSLNALNKTKDACATLGELLKKYPHASPSLRARATEEQAKMKCGKK